MSKKPSRHILATTFLGILGLALVAILLYQVPAVNSRLSWRVDLALTYLRGVVNPVKPFPTPAEVIHLPTETSAPLPTSTLPLETDLPTATPAASATPKPSPTPIPGAIQLAAPLWDQQTMNNCGPATLALYLRYYGWQGSQADISNVVKPIDEDRNVNPEELVFYVRTLAGWLNAEFRVGGDLQLIKQLVAAGFPVMIEESFYFEQPYWPNDDLWAAHYLLVTGYDEASQTFTGQDSFHGPNQVIPYATLDEYWQIFNRVYMLVYLPSQQEALRSILGDHWDPDLNRQHALEVAQSESQAEPDNPFAWFNLGSNLVYFERYSEAASAYDTARTLGLPQRMLRYQFGPFFAYFHATMTSELLAVTEYALERTPNAEEALLWHGWALYRQGRKAEALADWRKALEYRPGYPDAQYAIDFASSSP